MIQTAIIMGLASSIVTVLLTPVLIRLCRNRLFLDHPDGKRKIHRCPIPRCGGVGIVFSFILVLGLALLLGVGIPFEFKALLPRISCILLVSLGMFFVGLVDDLRGGLRASHKLVLQIVAASILWALGFRIQLITVPLIGPMDLGLFGGLALTVFWQVLVTNAFNFIDGMDGLAAGIALVVSISVLVLSVLTGKPDVVVLVAPLAGALIGYLPYNWNPAKIFMGDSGSYFLGFLLGAVSILSASKSTTILSFTVPVIMLGIPILDTVLTVGRRFIKSEPLFQADGDHIHHRLLKQGHRHTFVVFMLYGLNIVMAIFAAMSLLFSSAPYTIIIPLLMGVLTLWLIWHLGYDELHEVVGMVKRFVRFQRLVLSNQVRIRRYLAAFKKSPNILSLFGEFTKFLNEMNFEQATLDLWIDNDDRLNARHFQWLWCQTGTLAVDGTWSIRIPLVAKNGISGSLQLSRRMEWEQVMFQMASLLYLCNVVLANSISSHDKRQLCVFLNQQATIIETKNEDASLYTEGNRAMCCDENDLSQTRKLVMNTTTH